MSQLQTHIEVRGGYSVIFGVRVEENAMSTFQDVLIPSAAATAAASEAAAVNSLATGSTNSNSLINGVFGSQDFLTLLIAELTNQDPLNTADPTDFINPLDSTDFITQLSQSSSLDQLITSIDGLTTATNNSVELSALALLGKDITFSGGDFTYSGTPIQLGYTLDGPASQVQLSIQNSNGQVVQTLNGVDLTPGNHTLIWNGQDQNGNAVPSGEYNVSVTANSAGATGITATPFLQSEVIGVDLSAGGNPIINTNAGDIDFSQLIGVMLSSSLEGGG